jgi:hypothetical protein
MIWHPSEQLRFSSMARGFLQPSCRAITSLRCFNPKNRSSRLGVPVRILCAGLRSDDDETAGRAFKPDDDMIKYSITGNLCRCAAYPEVLGAMRLASQKRKDRSSKQR